MLNASSTGLFEWDSRPTAQRQQPLAPLFRCKKEVGGERLGMRAIELRLLSTTHRLDQTFGLKSIGRKRLLSYNPNYV